VSKTMTAPSAPRGGAAARLAVTFGALLPRGWSRHAQTVLIVGVWAGVLVPRLIDSLTVAKGFTPITDGAAPLAGVAGAATTAANGLMVVICAGVVLLRAPTLSLRRVPVLALLLAPWVIAATQLTLLGRPPAAPALVYPAVVVAFWALRPGPSAVEVVGYLAGATAVASLCLGVFAPAAGRYPLDVAGLDKVIGPAGVLSGVMPTGNNLGLVLVVALPTVFAIRRRSFRWASLGAVVIALAWTVSRTSWIAAVVVVVTMAAVRWLWRPRLVAVAGLGLLALAGMVIPFVTSQPTAFTNRASYWIPTLAAWRDRPITGFGADYFKQIAGTAQGLGGHAYHAHNQWVHLLVTGGLLLAVAVLALLVVAGVRAVGLAAARVPWGAGWLVAMLSVSILEVPLGFVDRMMFLPVALVPLCLLICGDRPTAESRPGASPAAAASTGEVHG